MITYTPTALVLRFSSSSKSVYFPYSSEIYMLTYHYHPRVWLVDQLLASRDLLLKVLYLPWTFSVSSLGSNTSDLDLNPRDVYKLCLVTSRKKKTGALVVCYLYTVTACHCKNQAEKSLVKWNQFSDAPSCSASLSWLHASVQTAVHSETPWKPCGLRRPWGPAVRTHGEIKLTDLMWKTPLDFNWSSSIEYLLIKHQKQAAGTV